LRFEESEFEMSAKKIRVVIADDHEVVRFGIAAILSLRPDIEVVGQAANGNEAISVYRQLLPDVMTVDLRMPQLDGLAVVSAIFQEFNNANILVMTTYDTDQDILRSLKAGARGYLLKDSPSEEIAQTIRRVARGETVLPSAVAAKYIASTTRPALTKREVQILGLVSLGKSNKEISNAIHVQETTIKSHVRTLFEKLGVDSRTEAVAVAIQRGLIDGVRAC
jgi:two-component system, NarL family, response regulator